MPEYQFENIGSLRDHSLMEMLDGFSPASQDRSQRHEMRVIEAAKLWDDAMRGRIDPFFLREAMAPTSSAAWQHLCRAYPRAFNEAMSTSDFRALTVDVLDRTLLGYYSDVPIPNLGLVRTHPLTSFRDRKIFQNDGMVTPFNKLGEHEIHEQRALSQVADVTYFPDVYAAGAKITWRAIMNDDLGIFRDIPQRLAMGARRTKHKFITGLYVDANGPHASLFTAGFANIINIANGASANNPPLSAGGLSDALTVMMKQVDSGGDPILIPGNLNLVVGPALYVTAKNLMNMLTVDVTIEGGTKDSVAPTTAYPSRKLRVNNWLVGGLTLIQDPYMRLITTAAGVKDTQWMLFADPGSQERPALELGELSGYGEPQLFRKSPNTERINGGVDPMLGDFYSMAQEMKSFMAFGGTRIDGKSAVSSTGAGV